MAVAEAAHHLVVGVQRLIPPVQRGKFDALVDEGRGHPLEELGRVAVAEAAEHLVVGVQHFQRLRVSGSHATRLTPFFTFTCDRLCNQLCGDRQVQRPLLRCHVFRFVRNAGADFAPFFRRVIGLHESDQHFNQAVLPAAQQVVDVVHALAQVVLLAPGAAAGHKNGTAFYEAFELGAALTGAKARSFGDFVSERWRPQVGKDQIDAAFLDR